MSTLVAIVILVLALVGCNPPGAINSPAPVTPPAAPSPGPLDAAHNAIAHGLALVVLSAIADEFGDNSIEVRTFDLALSDSNGSYWAVVSDGPQPFRFDDEGDVINFFHIVAVYRLSPDRSWSQEISRIEIESAPHRISDAVLVSAAPGSAWIVLQGLTGAHAGTLDAIRFDLAHRSLSTALSHVSSRPYAGEITDLDGDGFPEFVLNTSNPYIFCYACDVEAHSARIYRRYGAALAEVPLQAPSGLSAPVAIAAANVVSLADADLWREARDLAAATARQSPLNPDLRWLSLVVSQTAMARLAHAGSSGQPVLTNVLAGEYEAVLDMMREYSPEDVFAPDGPLITGTAAETHLATMAVTILDYTDRAIAQRPEDPAIYAVRALGHALSRPPGLGQALETIVRANGIAPTDTFLQQMKAYLSSIN